MSRYARLRAAQRALAAAAPLPTRFAAGSAARSKLRELEASPLAKLDPTQPDAAAATSPTAPPTPFAPPTPSAPPTEWVEDLAAVDELLAGYATELRTVANGVPVSQFRATLPALLAEDRPAVVGLLDLCIADSSNERIECLQRIDYLVTLLAAEESPDGCRRVVNDPAQVAPRLRRLCAAKARRGDAEALRLAEQIREAADALDGGGDAHPIIQQVKAAKASMGDSYFHPTLLRSVTSYNLAAFNQLRIQADAERAEDQSFYDQLGIDASQDGEPSEAAEDDLGGEPCGAPVDVEPARPAAVPVAIGSVFESRGASALEHALQQRLLGKPAPAGPAGELAKALKMRELRSWERSAFGDDEAPAARAIRAGVTLGLALRLGDEAKADLVTLGLDLEAAQRRWLPELDKVLQQAIQKCMGEGDFERARNLQGTRAQWLSSVGPSAASIGVAEPAAALAQRDKVSPAAPRRAALGRAIESAPPAEPRRRPRRAPKASRTESSVARQEVPAGPKKSATWQRLIAMAAIGVILALGIHLVMGGPKARPADRDYVSASELQSLSPDLVEGYTVEQGGHKVFVATVSPSWLRRSAADREEGARSLSEKLGQTGVAEVLLLGESSRVELHLVENTIRTLRP